MDAPKSIERKEINGRKCTVAHLANGMVKVIFDDGEMVFLAPEEKAKPTGAVPTPGSEEADG